MASERGHEVSIIIPTRDRPARLARTLLSALEQKDVEAEVLIVDHARVYWNGRVDSSLPGRRFHLEPPVFPLRDWPEAIEIRAQNTTIELASYSRAAG